VTPLPFPKGFQFHTLPTGPAWIRPSIHKPLLSTWKKLNPQAPLRQAARRHTQHRLFAGRAPVVLLPITTTHELVVRPCVHGGLWGKFARDLYTNTNRALKEIERSSLLTSKKIPTPLIQAALFYPAGSLWRIDIVTSYIPNSLDLASFISTRPSSPARSRAFSSIRKLFHKCRQNGILHPDCNARNILLTQSPSHAWLLDVDAIQVEPQNPSQVDIANRNRLLRSLLKLAKLGALGFSEKEVPSLWRELFPSS